MQETEYRELSKEIGQVRQTMTEKLGEVLAGVRELGAEMRLTLGQVKDMRDDLEKVKEVATKAKDSTDSAHLRINALENSTVSKEKAGAVDDRVKKIEKLVYLVVSIVATGLIGGAIALLFHFAKGG